MGTQHFNTDGSRHRPATLDQDNINSLREVRNQEIYGIKGDKRLLKGIYRWADQHQHLSRIEVMVLSLIDESPQKFSFIREKLHLSQEKTVELVASMEIKGFVQYIAVSDSVTVRATEIVLLEFRRLDAMIGWDEAKMLKAVLNHAKDLHFAGFSTRYVCQILRELVDANPDLQFSRGYSALEISSLTIGEQNLLIILAEQFIKEGPDPINLDDFEIMQAENSEQPGSNGAESDDCMERVEMLSEALGPLVERGLVVTIMVRGEKTTFEKHMLSVKAVAQLFKGQRQLVRANVLTRQADLLIAKDIKKKDLFFGPHDNEQIQAMSTLLKPGKYQEYVRKLEENGISSMAGFILTGPPGTGKTEIVRQLARKYGHDVLVADVAKMEGEWWGESEKNYRELFRSCNYLAAVSDVPPILLFNEADAIVSKRMSVHSSSEKLSNTLQNILLDELERFEGIFIATTNLVMNMDKAFERRFPIKITLEYPSPEIAAKIWTSKIPSLPEEQALHLSRTFRFSGGQIDNIGRRCILYEVIHSSFPAYEIVEEYCREETLESEGAGRPKCIIGFLDS